MLGKVSTKPLSLNLRTDGIERLLQTTRFFCCLEPALYSRPVPELSPSKKLSL